VSIATADLHEAINTLWDASGLNEKFNTFWATADVASFPTLHDQEATPNQPFPYCVMDATEVHVETRMTKDSVSKSSIRTCKLQLNIHAEKNANDNRSTKQLAAYLVEEVMKVFGGHPTVRPQALTLTNGDHLLTAYQNDWPLRTELYKYQWAVIYLLTVEVPEALMQ